MHVNPLRDLSKGNVHQKATMDEQKHEPERQKRWFDSAGNLLSSTLSLFFYKVGKFVGARPLISVLLALVFTALCGSGLMVLVKEGQETRSDKLWIPTDTQAQEDKAYVDAHYGKEFRFENFIFKVKNKEESLLVPEAFDKMLDVHYNLTNVTAGKDEKHTNCKPTDDQPNCNFENMCLKRGKDCWMTNPLMLFNYKKEDWDTKEKIKAKLNEKPLTLPNGDVVEIGQMFGGITEDVDMKITAATAASFFYTLKNNETKDGDSYVDKRAEEWEEVWLDHVEEKNKELKKEKKYELSYFATRSFSDEFGGAIGADISLLNVAIILNLVYANVQLTQWSRGCRGVRVHVVLCGILAIGLAVISSYGVCAGAGVMYSPLMSVLPFLLLGIGVDDMFVIINELDNTSESESSPRRLALALAHAGPSITLTSLTDFFAFMIGSNTSLPALSAFCIYAGVGVVFCFIFQVVFFSAIAIMDINCKRGGCCCPSSCGPEAPMGKTCCGCAVKDNYMSTFIRTFIANPMRSMQVKAVVLAAFTAISIAGIYGCTQIQVQGDVNDFIPAGSYLLDYFRDQENKFDRVGEQVDLYIEGDYDYKNRNNWEKLEDLVEVCMSATSTVPGVSNSWFKEFKTAYNLSEPTYNQDNFYTDLKAYLNTDNGKRFTSDVVFRDDLSIETSRFTCYHEKKVNSQDKVKLMDNLRSEIKGAKINENERKAFPYSSQYLQFEQYKAIEQEAAQNLGLCMLAVSIVVFALIVNPVASMFVVLSVGLVVMNTVGFMYLWDLNIDNVTVIMLVLALGLSVDYSAHIGHSFMFKQGSKDDRMVEAMCDMGVAVFNGAASTFMAVVVLGASKSYVFITFFKQLFLCTTLGVSHGLILLPVMLGTFGPPAYEMNAAMFEHDGDAAPEGKEDLEMH